MKEQLTKDVDEFLQSVASMKEVGTDDFFYTRLRARIEKKAGQQSWQFPLKPAWVVSGLALLLVINGFMLSNQIKKKDSNTIPGETYTVQNFAAAYDQSISSY